MNISGSFDDIFSSIQDSSDVRFAQKCCVSNADGLLSSLVHVSACQAARNVCTNHNQALTNQNYRNKYRKWGCIFEISLSLREQKRLHYTLAPEYLFVY